MRFELRLRLCVLGQYLAVAFFEIEHEALAAAAAAAVTALVALLEAATGAAGVFGTLSTMVCVRLGTAALGAGM